MPSEQRAKSGTRDKPLCFSNIFEALESAKILRTKVWCRLWSQVGLFEVFPGGRIVRRAEVIHVAEATTNHE